MLGKPSAWSSCTQSTEVNLPAIQLIISIPLRPLPPWPAGLLQQGQTQTEGSVEHLSAGTVQLAKINTQFSDFKCSFLLCFVRIGKLAIFAFVSFIYSVPCTSSQRAGLYHTQTSHQQPHLTQLQEVTFPIAVSFPLTQTFPLLYQSLSSTFPRHP